MRALKQSSFNWLADDINNRSFLYGTGDWPRSRGIGNIFLAVLATPIVLFGIGMAIALAVIVGLKEGK